jgi:hypothetical protein
MAAAYELMRATASIRKSSKNPSAFRIRFAIRKAPHASDRMRQDAHPAVSANELELFSSHRRRRHHGTIDAL